MSKQILQMKYHPAKKEVEFKRFQSGKEIPIRSDSILTTYMNKRGKFVLQDHGNTFLEHITKAFDGEKIVNIEVETTKIDFEDFMQMVEYFNEASSCRINATLLSELPDMNETYRAVKEHGEKSISILKKHQTTFFDIPRGNANVKKCVETFSTDLQTEINSIKEKIGSLSENTINLCFAGVYSAGKSALINSILGYSILPENINSETARMFRIQSPKAGEAIRIIFSIGNHYTELVWTESMQCFEFVAGPAESNSRRNIQDIINKCKGNLQHRQIYEILKALNNDRNIYSDIKIYFPIPIDNDKVQFSIYDTPGTDSNYGDHQEVLRDALSEQTHSILIFVAAPNKTEGEGNNALLSYLKEAERKDSKTSIDIGRSLFVINWADSIGPTQRKDLQTAEIKDKTDESFSIKLSDKKLFFTSAKIAYAAKAKYNGIETEEEEFTIETDGIKVSNPKFGCYYQQNRCATSEYATQKMIEMCSQALEKAKENNDNLKILHICSGLYALENEITTYGEKYASAVRAFAIIDSIDKALSKMNNNARSLERQNSEDINKIEAEIEFLRKTIEKSIQIAYARRKISDLNEMPDGVLKELCLDSDSLATRIIGQPKSFIEKLLRGRFFGLFKVKFQEKHKKEIIQKITSVLDDFTREFLKKRRDLLENLRDDFIDDIKKTIHENGELSNEAKQVILEIRPPKIKEYSNIRDFGEMYDNRKRSETFLFVDREDIDKDGFLRDAEFKLGQIAESLHNDYTKDYSESLEGILDKVKNEFAQNMKNYSVLLRAKHEDKEAMEQLRKRIANVAFDLERCQKELDLVIWSAKKNG